MKVPVTDKGWESKLEEAVSAINNNNCFLFSANQDAASVGALAALGLYLIRLDKIFQYNYLRVVDN